MTGKERLDLFKKDILLENLTPERILRKYIINGPTYFFQKPNMDPSLEPLIKSLIAEALLVNLKEIYVVGSGKLGFSLNPNKLFNEFDYEFSITKQNKDKSDLDIVIISRSLYDNIGRNMYNFTAAYRDKWKSNEYYSIEKARQFPVDICYKYFEYFTRGWFRPDFKPLGFEFCAKGSFEELKGSLRKKIGRKVSLAVYQNWFYFTNYHLTNIKNLTLRIKTEKI